MTIVQRRAPRSRVDDARTGTGVAAKLVLGAVEPVGLFGSGPAAPTWSWRSDETPQLLCRTTSAIDFAPIAFQSWKFRNLTVHILGLLPHAQQRK